MFFIMKNIINNIISKWRGSERRAHGKGPPPEAHKDSVATIPPKHLLEKCFQ